GGMSAVAALDAPLPSRGAPQPRHIEIVPARRQKRARPRAAYALVTVAGLFAILIAQLLLSIVVSEGAYQISSLQQEQRELARDQQAISEELQVLESPQHLAANAETLGMVSNSSTAYLRLADGAVLGSPVAAKATDGIRQGKDGGPLIANELLDDVPMTAVAATSAETGDSAGAGAPGALASSGSVASTSQGLPSPITR
ncbi:MAG TPA: hypothetical protein VFS93_02965, partial [Terrimesophilobacter sp.]|nr:hypothetical protein [Terrimesophilobacter sp.]